MFQSFPFNNNFSECSKENIQKVNLAQEYFESNNFPESTPEYSEWLTRLDNLVNELRKYPFQISFQSEIYKLRFSNLCNSRIKLKRRIRVQSFSLTNFRFKAGMIESKIYSDGTLEYNSAYNLAFTDFLRIMGITF